MLDFCAKALCVSHFVERFGVDSFNIPVQSFVPPMAILFQLSFIAIVLSCIDGPRCAHHALIVVTIVLENSSDVTLRSGNH